MVKSPELEDKKICAKCLQRKPYSEFGKSKRNPGKPTKSCKPCLREIPHA